ncbi:MAG TPA: hypothetical protein VMD07_01315 [Candidatus Acidoferrales bacterium]|nr:hypothetical protein [Candidatus Acidoferrales bacterium]
MEAAVQAALPAGFTELKPESPSQKGRTWVRKSDHIDAVLNLYSSPVRLWICQFEKVAPTVEYDGSLTPVPLWWERVGVSLGSGLVVGEDAQHSYVLARLEQWSAHENVQVGDPLSPIRWKLVNSEIRFRDEQSGWSLLATSRLHVKPARFIGHPVGNADVRIISNAHWTAHTMRRTWIDPGDPPLPPVDLGVVTSDQPAILTQASADGTTFELVSGATEWHSAIVVDAGRHGVVGFAGGERVGVDGPFVAIDSSKISALGAKANLTLAHDSTALQARSAPAPTVKPATVAAAGIAAVDGSEIPVPVTWQHAGIVQDVGDGLVVAEDAKNSYVLVKLADWVLPDPIYIGDPQKIGDAEKPSIWILVKPDLRFRDEKTGLSLYAVPRLHVRPARFARSVKQGESVRIITNKGFLQNSARDNWFTSLHTDDGIVGAVHSSPPSFEYAAGTLDWAGGSIVDQAGAVLGFADWDGQGMSRIYLARPASVIADLLKNLNLSLSYATEKATPQIAAPTVSSLSDVVMASAESSLAVVDCPVKDALHQPRATGVVIATTADVSYVVTAENRKCNRTVYVGGDLRHGYPARSIDVDQSRSINYSVPNNLEVIAIPRGNLRPATFTRDFQSGSVFVLSYAQPVPGSSAARVSARVNEAVLSSLTGYPNLNAANGIGIAGGVFDPKTGRLIGVVSFSTDLTSLFPDQRPSPRVGYQMISVDTLISYVHLLKEMIRL